MTETTATSGGTATPAETEPVDHGPRYETHQGTAGRGAEPHAGGGSPTGEPVPPGEAHDPKDSAAPATSRVATGRATVRGESDSGPTATSGSPDTDGPYDTPFAATGYSSGEPAPSATRPNFTRAPGMPPPPDRLDAGGGLGRADPFGSVPTSGAPTAGNAGVASPFFTVRPGGGPVAGAFTATAAATPSSAPPAPSSAPPSAPGQASGQASTAVTVRPLGTGAAVGAARVSDAVRATRAAPAPARGPRRARLTVRRVDPWSVMKFSFAVSLVMFIVVIVATAVLYLALDAMGVFTSVNSTLADLVESGGGSGDGFRITAQGVIGTAALLGAVNVVLFTALATLAAFIYNVCADLVGGVEVTLSERD